MFSSVAGSAQHWANKVWPGGGKMCYNSTYGPSREVCADRSQTKNCRNTTETDDGQTGSPQGKFHTPYLQKINHQKTNLPRARYSRHQGGPADSPVVSSVDFVGAFPRWASSEDFFGRFLRRISSVGSLKGDNRHPGGHHNPTRLCPGIPVVKKRNSLAEPVADPVPSRTKLQS